MATTDGYLRFFPYGEPYPNQREAMDRIANALHRGQDVLFEGACGTGKTLAALAPALEHARDTDRTVVITTNVHQQMRQFVHEARAIAETEDLRAVVFRGKGSMCHIDVDYQECQALRDNTREAVELEAEVAQLERRQRDLLEAAQAGDEEATAARADVMDALEAAEGDLAEATDAATCEHYRANLTADNADFFAWLYDDVRTPDEIYEYADERGRCGYELLKEGIDGVDLVVCNYHHLLDPGIREHFFRWLDRDPEEVVAVFDEAHNLEDAARDHATRTLAERTLDSALDECRESEDARVDRAENVLGAFRTALLETYEEAFEFGERERVGEDWYDLAVADPSGDDDGGRDDLFLAFLSAYEGSGIDGDLEAAETLGRELDAAYEEAYREGETSVRKESPTLQAARFVRAYKDEGDAPGQYPVVGVRRDGTTDELVGRAELFQCLPNAVTGTLLESLHASVLMSATLRPFDVTEAVLGVEDSVSLAYPLAFPPERRRTVAVETPALFASERDDPDVQADLSDALADTIRFTPGNVLAFFPSYGEARRYHGLLADRVEADCYLDQPATRADELRDRVTDAANAVLFTSLWGTLSEGVSFDGNDARAAVVVGVPYPRLDERSEAIQAAYAEAFGDRGGDQPGWELAVEVPTIRKTRQALGRVVRGPEDFGVRVLIDERYTARGAAEMGKYAVRESFPVEERDELVDVAPGKLRFSLLNFFADLDAYDGEPPSP